MTFEQALITWVHLVSASIWVGGGLFLGAVLAPILKRTTLRPAERMELMISIGKRFNKIAVPALGALIVTGIYSSYGLLGRPELLLESSYGWILIIKMALVGTVIAAFVIHVRIIGGKVESRIGQMSESEIRSLRRRIIILGESVTVISIAILLLAAMLDAGV